MQDKVDKALKILGVKNFLLGIHDAALPSLSEEDLGRGTPYSEGAAEFFGFARSLGFTGIQLGPQGITTAANPSPYDSSFFSRDPLLLAPLALTRPDYCRLLDPERPEGLVAQQLDGAANRVNDMAARMASQSIAAEVCSRYRRGMRRGKSVVNASLGDAFARYRHRNNGWLERDALYQVLRQHYGGRSWRQWTGGSHARLDRHLFAPPAGMQGQARKRIAALRRRYSETLENYALIQFLLARQHGELRARCRQLGLKLFGDCHIGFSGRDGWYAQAFLLGDYVMGAPPSRTNPEGQPWNYPLLDPHLYFSTGDATTLQPGAAVRFFAQRIEKLVDEFDGLRLDHPHGLVCPWVYRTGQDDPLAAVQNGARLFSSPSVTDHPLLSKYAIVKQDQLNSGKPRYDDDWVADLDEHQVRRYASLFDVVIETARRKWSGLETVACEILSTQPYPIKRVMDIYGLGRFRVTLKADLANEYDVYRGENARPQDWVMPGNHDTATIRQTVANWFDEETSSRQAVYLADRLAIPKEKRTGWIEHVSKDPGALIQARYGELFVGPAQNIMVYFTDLLGCRQTYNKPGTVNNDNWTLRVPKQYTKHYSDRLADNLALNIPMALAAALRAKGTTAGENRDLIRALENDRL
ncbi:MAG: 4-alpha-glucanotransferase [Desulforhopalus sp.]